MKYFLFSPFILNWHLINYKMGVWWNIYLYQPDMYGIHMHGKNYLTHFWLTHWSINTYIHTHLHINTNILFSKFKSTIQWWRDAVKTLKTILMPHIHVNLSIYHSTDFTAMPNSTSIKVIFFKSMQGLKRQLYMWKVALINARTSWYQLFGT